MRPSYTTVRLYLILIPCVSSSSLRPKLRTQADEVSLLLKGEQKSLLMAEEKIRELLKALHAVE
jgi:hypothetical protein